MITNFFRSILRLTLTTGRFFVSMVITVAVIIAAWLITALLSSLAGFVLGYILVVLVPDPFTKFPTVSVLTTVGLMSTFFVSPVKAAHQFVELSQSFNK